MALQRQQAWRSRRDIRVIRMTTRPVLATTRPMNGPVMVGCDARRNPTEGDPVAYHGVSQC